MILTRFEKMGVVGILVVMLLFVMVTIWNDPQLQSPREQAESEMRAELAALYVPTGIVEIMRYESSYLGIDLHDQACGISHVRIVYGSERTVQDLRAGYDAALKLAGWIPDGTYTYQRAPSREITFDYVIAADRQLSFPTEFAVFVSIQRPATGVCYQPR